MTNSLPYYVGFSHFLPIGPMKFRDLMGYFKDIKDAYYGKINDLTQVVGQDIAERFVKHRNSFDMEKTIRQIQKKNIVIVSREDERFPKTFLEISDPPICIYIKGDMRYMSDTYNHISIVGTRKPSSYGIYVAKKLSGELSSWGIVLVSGMAFGIDAIVHRLAIDNKSKTIAVLGCGVDIPYPIHNSRLYDDIINGNGAVISEIPPGLRVVPGMFVTRNRLISALSPGTIIIEGLKNSGTLITARYAAQQGKEVFAVPSPITSILSEAPNLLLQQGAHVVTCAKDVIDVLGWKATGEKSETTEYSKEERMILEKLQHEAYSADDLSKALDVPVSVLLKTISILEIKGLIEKDNDAKYQIR